MIFYFIQNNVHAIQIFIIADLIAYIDCTYMFMGCCFFFKIIYYIVPVFVNCLLHVGLVPTEVLGVYFL